MATHKRIKLDYSRIPYTKNNSKWIKDVNSRLETMKFLEENLGSNLINIGHRDIFGDLTPRQGKHKQKYTNKITLN